MKRAAYKMRFRVAGAAFVKWRSMVQEVLDNRRKVAGALHRFLMRAVSAAWNSWHEYAVTRRRARKLQKKVAARMMGALLVICFDRWAEAAAGAAAEKQRKIMAMIQKWRLMPAMLAFRAWYEHLLKMRKCRKFAKQMIWRSAKAALRSWEELVMRNKRARALMKRMVLRNQKQREARLFDGWYDYYMMMLDEKDAKIRRVLCIFECAESIRCRR